jgi:hypothetical protein
MRGDCCYRIFGLIVRSCVPLPAPDAPGDAVPDVIVSYGTVGGELPGAISRNQRYQAAPGALLLTVDGIARYFVTSRDIVIDRDDEASDTDVQLFLLGSAIGALLHQRDDLVLHGSAIGVSGAAVGFLGVSGVGKSTLAAAFRRRGYPVLTDDLCVVRAAPDGTLHTQPGLRQMKLWEDALEGLEIPAAALSRVRAGIDKRHLPVETGFSDRALPLSRLYVLSVGDADTIELTPLHGSTRFKALMDHTYRSSYLEGLDVRASHFRSLVATAQVTPVTSVRRPAASPSLDQLVDRLAGDFLH